MRPAVSVAIDSAASHEDRYETERVIIYELEKRGSVVPLPWKSNRNTYTQLEGGNDRPK